MPSYGKKGKKRPKNAPKPKTTAASVDDEVTASSSSGSIAEKKIKGVSLESEHNACLSYINNARNMTGNLASHPDGRDIHITGFSMTYW